jgi:hypothetical protein
VVSLPPPFSSRGKLEAAIFRFRSASLLGGVVGNMDFVQDEDMATTLYSTTTATPGG